jgi:hypothetical protein
MCIEIPSSCSSDASPWVEHAYGMAVRVLPPRLAVRVLPPCPCCILLLGKVRRCRTRPTMCGAHARSLTQLPLMPAQVIGVPALLLSRCPAHDALGSIIR